MAGPEKPAEVSPVTPKASPDDVYRNFEVRTKVYQDVTQRTQELLKNPYLTAELKNKIVDLQKKVATTTEKDHGQIFDGGGADTGYHLDAGFFKRQIGRLERQSAQLISEHESQKDAMDADALLTKFDKLPKPKLFTKES